MTSGSPSFTQACALTPVASGAWSATVDPGWLQGRGAFGGLVAAMLLRAGQELCGQPARLPRTLNVHFCAPALPGRLDVTARVARQGATISHVVAEAHQQGGLVTTAVITFAASRPGATLAHNTLVLPADVLPFAETQPVPREAPMPVFTQNFEYRFCGGTLPFSGGDHATMASWISPRIPVVQDAAYTVALLDVLPPAAFGLLDRPAAGASVDLRMDLLAVPPGGVAEPSAQPCLVHSAAAYTGDGYSREDAWLFAADGTPLGRGRQMVVLL